MNHNRILPTIAIVACCGYFPIIAILLVYCSSLIGPSSMSPDYSSLQSPLIPNLEPTENGSAPRKLFTTTATKCPTDVVASSANNPNVHPFRGQSGEDKKLMNWFGNLCNGTYIEMGALDGVRFSNSHAFNKGPLMWKGVLIEIMKHNYKKLVINRPNEIATINAGVCSVPQKLHYFFNEGKPAVGGIYEFSTAAFRDRWWKKGITIDDPQLEDIQCDRLDSLLIQHAPEHTFFDFFSLDVEGAELSVLQSIDFNRVGFGIVLVEADGHNQFKNLAMRLLLESNGYVYLESWERSYWFANKDFYKIYRGLIH